VAPAEHVLRLGDRRHAVVVGDTIEAEQPRLQRVPTLRDVVAGDHGVDECLHRLVARLVLEVAAREPAVVVAEPVVDVLVGEQRVEHERARPQARLERGGHGLGGRAAHLAVGRLKAREPFLEADGLAVDVDLDRRRQLAEQARPGAAPGRRLVGDDPLLRLAQQVGPVATERPQVMATEVEPRVVEQRLDVVVVELGPLEVEEEQLVGDRGGALLGARQQGTPRRVLRVGRELEPRVRTRLADELGDRGELLHQRHEIRGVEVADPAPIRPDLVGDGLRFVEQRVDALVAAPVHEGLDVPRDVGGRPVGLGELGGCAHGEPG